MKAKKVLFVCIHNSARSQMAEVFLNEMGAGQIEAESAGINPGKLNSVVVDVMKELDIDISQNRTKSVQEVISQGWTYDYIVTVCDEASAQQCPVIPGGGERLHFGFDDPSSFEGSDDEKLAMTRNVRDAIRLKIKKWVQEVQRE